MAKQRGATDPPADVDGDDCLAEYRHLFSPDILAGRVAFITGGGSGIGFRIAEIFMRHGCRTAIAGRNQQRVAECGVWDLVAFHRITGRPGMEGTSRITKLQPPATGRTTNIHV